MDFIERLRQKPSGTKKTIAFVTSAVVTLAIFGVWISAPSLGVEQKSADSTASVASASGADVNPFSALVEVIANGWNGLTDNINQVKTKVEDVGKIINTFSTSTVNDASQDVVIISDDSAGNVVVQ